MSALRVLFAAVILMLPGALLPTHAPAQTTKAQITKPATQRPTQREALTNEDVLRMVQAGLGESVVVAAIRTAPRTAFQLDPDSLIALKKGGVSDNIVAVMLDPKSTVAPAPTATPIIGLPTGNADTRARTTEPSAPVEVPRDPGIYFDSGNGMPNLIALEPTTFSQGKSGGVFTSALTYGIKKAKWKAVVRSRNATFRLRTPTPTFYFYFEQKSSGLGNTGGFTGWLSGATSPNEFVLAKMSAKDKERELIVGEFGAFGASTGTRSKDTVEFKAERMSGGAYRVTLLDRLTPGEYCFFYASGASALGAGATGKLFDFGVDPQSITSDERR